MAGGRRPPGPAMALAIFLLALTGSPVAAQSFLQSVFGFFSGAPANRSVSPRRPEPPKSIPWVGSQEDRDAAARSRRSYSSERSAGPWRTMCVRLCDGYYFPMSTGVSDATVRDDAKSCEDRCGVPARLYYLDKESDDIAGMVDLKGRTYADLEAAFRYRKRLIDGCTCRPMPWSAAEQARHKRYEIYDAYMKIQAERDAEEERRAEAQILELAGRQETIETVETASADRTDSGDAQTDDRTEQASDSDPTVEPAFETRMVESPLGERRTRRSSIDRHAPSRRAGTKRANDKAPVTGFSALFPQASSGYNWPGDR